MTNAPGMEAIASLSAASFLTSLLTAAIGIGGGLGLLSVMPSFMPMAAVVPLHGITQFVSNASRFVFDYRQADTHLLPAYFTGACLGSVVGYLFIGRIPELYLSAALGLFILLCTWTGLVTKLGKIFTNFFSIAFIQTFLSLFVASVGLISQPVLIKQGLPKNRVIVTHAMQMSVLHGLKVFAFVAAGFPFLRYWDIAAALIIASAAGTYFGGFFRDRIPERLGTIGLKAGISFFACKMIADAANAAVHGGLPMIVYTSIGVVAVAALAYVAWTYRDIGSINTKHRHASIKAKTFGVSDRVFDFLEAEWRVAETNARIERQRQLIEKLVYEGQDITSAQIVFDSLCVSLSLHLQHRYRLRAVLNFKTAAIGRFCCRSDLKALANSDSVH